MPALFAIAARERMWDQLCGLPSNLPAFLTPVQIGGQIILNGKRTNEIMNKPSETA